MSTTLWKFRALKTVYLKSERFKKNLSSWAVKEKKPLKKVAFSLTDTTESDHALTIKMQLQSKKHEI